MTFTEIEIWEKYWKARIPIGVLAIQYNLTEAEIVNIIGR